MTLGSCNVINDNDIRCNSKHQLHFVLFIDPHGLSHVEVVNVCKTHYDNIMKGINEELNLLTLEINNLFFEDRRQRAIAKENGVNYSTSILQIKLNQKIDLKKRISLEQCRNYFCKKNLKTLSTDTKIYSISTFKPSGKRQNTFYLCSFNCFRRMKGVFGLTSPLFNQQFTLETFGKMLT